ncbi:hypothetical protein H8D36_03740 [archaeon]|nr:hypothetical protein [archaeon]MBL7056961.1 hypothetical protein [Candidatus Woesearchaeota archaeon]
MSWETINRPGQTGSNKQVLFAQYDAKFGNNNWRLAWTWGNQFLDFLGVCQIYEDGYYHDSFEREAVWQELLMTASEVWDIQENDVQSGLDYTIQTGPANHLQDIAVRNVIQRRGWEFQGDELIRIRKHEDYWGALMSPGLIPFHQPDLIVQPLLEGWWKPHTIEDFYQSNKVLQARK